MSTPQDIDEMWRVMWDSPIGPFQLMDRVGLDVVKDIELHYMEENPALSDKSLRVVDEYIDRGDLGVKTGKGFYDYSAE